MCRFDGRLWAVLLAALAAAVLLAAPLTAEAASGPIWFESPGYIDPPGTANIVDVEAWMLDGDDDYDLVAASAASPSLLLSGNDGDGTYTLLDSASSAHGSAVALAVGDFDYNGTRDFVVGTTQGYLWRTFGSGTGDIVTTGEQWVDLGSADRIPHEIQTVHLPPRYDIGVVATIPSRNEVRVYANDGHGVLSLKQVITMPAGSDPRGVAVGYLDSDSYDDLAVAAHGTDKVHVYRGLADGTFAESAQLAAGDGPYDVVTGDFGGAGEGDLAVCGQHDRTVTIRRQSATGSWLAADVRTTGGTPYGMLSSAIELSDDAPEIVVVDNGSRALRFLLNDDTHVLPMQAYTVPTDAYALGVCVAEADANEKVDLAVWGGDRIWLYPFSGWPRVQRFGGADRYETSAVISRSLYGTADTVVIATGENFPDALSGAPLAAMMHGPLLITRTAALPDVISAEVSRLRATTAYVLGADASVSEDVETDLRAAGVTTIHRLAGANRYDTARLIAQTMENVSADDITTAFVATGENFPDGLAAGSIAAHLGRPILLARRDSLPIETRTAIGALGVTDTWVLGSTAAIGGDVFDALPHPTRLQGADRYGTASAVADWAIADGAAGSFVLLATGERFPDALCLGNFGAAGYMPMILTRTASVPPATAAYAAAHMRDAVILAIGGSTSAVSEETAQAVRTGY